MPSDKLGNRGKEPPFSLERSIKTQPEWELVFPPTVVVRNNRYRNLSMFNRKPWCYFSSLFVVALTISTALTDRLSAQSPVKLKNYEAILDTFEDETSVFELEGVASHLGKFTAYGDVDLVPGPLEGWQVGEGSVVFRAANGDQLVGIASWILGPVGDDGNLDISVQFSWRAFVELRDGTIVANTWRFVDSRPPGLIVTDKYCCTTICLPFVGCFVRCEKCTTSR